MTDTIADMLTRIRNALVAKHESVDVPCSTIKKANAEIRNALSLLLDRELVEPCGNLDAPGRPNLYRTTEAFLRSFGLASLDNLPPLPEELNREEGGDDL